MSGESEALSSHEGDEDEKEEEEEINSPPKGRRKKRAAYVDPEAEAPKRGKYPSWMARILMLKPSPSGAPGQSPLPHHKYMRGLSYIQSL